MTVTTLDPETALIVVDLQAGVMGMPTVHPTEEVLENSIALAEAFRAKGLPVVLVNVTGGAPGRTEQTRATVPRPEGWDILVPELGPKPGDITVTKQTWGAFASTDLDARLRALGVTQVVLTGISTSSGVESTARQAYEAGYNVTIATDGVTDTNPDAHFNGITRVFPRLGETGTTAAILELLASQSVD